MSLAVAILGAGGQVGQALTLAFARDAPEIKVLALGRTADLTAIETWKPHLDGFAPDIVINAAAFTAVDACEADPARAFAVNADAVADLARWCLAAGAALVHISTDYVFGDDALAPMTVSDRVSPLNVYGRSKHAGEVHIAAILPRHVILRTSWVYGPAAGNFFATVMRLASLKDQLSVVENEASCPTFAPDLAAALVRVAQTIGRGEGVFGTFHCAGEEGLSRLAFAQAIMDIRSALGLSTATIVPTTQAAYGAPAQRPIDSRLDCSAFAQAYGLTLPGLSARLPALVSQLAGQ